MTFSIPTELQPFLSEASTASQVDISEGFDNLPQIDKRRVLRALISLPAVQEIQLGDTEKGQLRDFIKLREAEPNEGGHSSGIVLRDDIPIIKTEILPTDNSPNLAWMSTPKIDKLGDIQFQYYKSEQGKTNRTLLETLGFAKRVFNLRQETVGEKDNIYKILYEKWEKKSKELLKQYSEISEPYQEHIDIHERTHQLYSTRFIKFYTTIEQIKKIIVEKNKPYNDGPFEKIADIHYRFYILMESTAQLYSFYGITKKYSNQNIFDICLLPQLSNLSLYLSQEKFIELVQGTQNLSPNNREYPILVNCIATICVLTGNDKTYEKMLSLHNDHEIEEFRLEILNSWEEFPDTPQKFNGEYFEGGNMADFQLRIDQNFNTLISELEGIRNNLNLID